jgi:hypothetical protein
MKIMDKLKRHIKLLALTCFLIIGTIAQAQLTILIGQVKDQATGGPIANHTVTIISFYDTITQSGIDYHHTLTTNGQGYFIDTVSSVDPNTDFFVSLYDCNQQLHTDTINSSNLQLIEFNICSNPNICNADFYGYPDVNDYKKIHFNNISSGNPNTYMWIFGDGSSSFSASPSHQYATDGSYVVQLQIWTPTGCTDIYVDTLVVSANFHCSANFTWNEDPQSSSISFKGDINNIYYTIYQWDFGDGHFGSGKNITHHYSSPGTYQVNVLSTSIHPITMDTCVSSYSSTVVLSPPLTGDLFGQIFLDTLAADTGRVILYLHNDQNSFLFPVDTAPIVHVDSLNMSYYIFEDVLCNKYVVRAELGESSYFYHSFSPTYSGNTLFWNSASAIEVVDSMMNYQSINLNLINLSNGTAEVQGTIYEGHPMMPGNPIPNANIYLLDENNILIAHTLSDSIDGSYSFTHLEKQKYFIYADIINAQASIPMVEPTNTYQFFTDVNIYLQNSPATALNDNSQSEELKLFPNPGSDLVTLEFNLSESQMINIQVITPLGQIIRELETQGFVGQNNTSIDIRNLESGIYFVLVKSNDQSKEIKLIKR